MPCTKATTRKRRAIWGGLRRAGRSGLAAVAATLAIEEASNGPARDGVTPLLKRRRNWTRAATPLVSLLQ